MSRHQPQQGENYSNNNNLATSSSSLVVFDDAAVRKMEELYTTVDAIAQRAATIRAVQPREGEVGLDVGVGPGFLLCELAEKVGPSGKMYGIDLSADMLENCKRRAASFGITAENNRMELVKGDATILPFPDETFDFVVSTQVLEYVPDIEKALREIHRVLKRGTGRAVILDTDFDALIIHTDDVDLNKRMLAGYAPHVAHNHLPRHLAHLLSKCGFYVANLENVAILNLEYTPERFGYHLCDFIANYVRQQAAAAAAAGDEEMKKQAEDDVNAWLADLQRQADRGSFFFSMNRYQFTALKKNLNLM